MSSPALLGRWRNDGTRLQAQQRAVREHKRKLSEDEKCLRYRWVGPPSTNRGRPSSSWKLRIALHQSVLDKANADLAGNTMTRVWFLRRRVATSCAWLLQKGA